MRIKVCTKHFIVTAPPSNGKPAVVTFDYDQDFFFHYENNIIWIEGTSWKKEVKDMEEGLNCIQQYFHGTNYQIVDLVNMLN
jgi:hypothetical protein